jgi:hypothetical protein
MGKPYKGVVHKYFKTTEDYPSTLPSISEKKPF